MVVAVAAQVLVPSSISGRLFVLGLHHFSKKIGYILDGKSSQIRALLTIFIDINFHQTCMSFITVVFALNSAKPFNR